MIIINSLFIQNVILILFRIFNLNQVDVLLLIFYFFIIIYMLDYQINDQHMINNLHIHIIKQII